MLDNLQFALRPWGSYWHTAYCNAMQEKHLNNQKKLYYAFVDIEEAFDKSSQGGN